MTATFTLAFPVQATTARFGPTRLGVGTRVVAPGEGDGGTTVVQIADAPGGVVLATVATADLHHAIDV